MNLGFALRTIFEIIMVALLFWCIFNENKLIAFEKRIISNIRRRRLKVVKHNISYRVADGR